MTQTKLALEKAFFKDELHDVMVYRALETREKKKDMKKLLGELAKTEEKHSLIWKGIIEENGEKAQKPLFVNLYVAYYIFIKLLFGTAFATKLLEKGEEKAIVSYSRALAGSEISKPGKAKIKGILIDEKKHQKELMQKIEKYEGDLNYIKSIIFGLNDGLVELMAVVAGLAVVVTTGFVVAIAGFVVGISGTLSMAAGEYLSSKSRRLVTVAVDKESYPRRTTPRKEAFFIGIFYFIGSLISILPFAFGLSGYYGILASVILVTIALLIVSTIVATISETSIKSRAAEMLAVSLCAAAITITLGIVLRYYFGISV